MTLLNKLQSALNKLYGNTIFLNDPDDGKVSHKDKYKCDCGELVPEEEGIDELKICKECYQEHYGGKYCSIDEAEYKKGDR